MKNRVNPHGTWQLKFHRDRVDDGDDGKRADISGGELLALSAKGNVPGRKPNRLPDLVGGSWNSMSIRHSLILLSCAKQGGPSHFPHAPTATGIAQNGWDRNLDLLAREQGGLIA